MSKTFDKISLNHIYDGSIGDRLSLEIDDNYVLSLTENGVRLFMYLHNISMDSNAMPKVFRGECDDWDDLPIVSTQEKNGIKVDIESDGESIIIAAYNDKTCGRNWLLKITPQGIYRYSHIDYSIAEALGLPLDDKRRLQILRK